MNKKVKSDLFQLPQNSILVIIDGECVACSWFVKQIVLRDAAKRFYFIGRRHPKVQLTVSSLPQEWQSVDSVFVFYNSTMYSKSEAVILVLEHLGGFKLLVWTASCYPKWFLDWLYSGFAIRRKKWFGTKNTCSLAEKAVSFRFVD